MGRTMDPPGLSTGRGRGYRSGVLTLLFSHEVIPQSWSFRSRCRSGARLSGGESARHVGGKAMIFDQQIIGGAALILGEGGPPCVRRGVCPRQAFAQRAFAVGNRFRLEPERGLSNDAIER